jgi:hypothetical protein
MWKQLFGTADDYEQVDKALDDLRNDLDRDEMAKGLRMAKDAITNVHRQNIKIKELESQIANNICDMADMQKDIANLRRICGQLAEKQNCRIVTKDVIIYGLKGKSIEEQSDLVETSIVSLAGLDICTSTTLPVSDFVASYGTGTVRKKRKSKK